MQNSKSQAGNEVQQSDEVEVSTSAPIMPNPMLPAVLRLNVKKQWFDMIKAGIKKEEYRDIKPYWEKRLVKSYTSFRDSDSVQTTIDEYTPFLIDECYDFDFVEFKNGYSKDAPKILVECQKIIVREPNTKWGGFLFMNDNGEVAKCFVIKLGSVIA